MQKNNNIVKAVNKNVRSSPRKISLVLDHIRGKKVGAVLRDLDFIRKKISLDVSKTVKSAIANAELEQLKTKALNDWLNTKRKEFNVNATFNSEVHGWLSKQLQVSSLEKPKEKNNFK